MRKGLFQMLIMVAISAFVALFVVRVFDDWYQDCEERRAHKREQRNRNQHNRYE